MSYDPNGDALSSNNYINKYTKAKKEMPRSIIFTVLLAVIVIGLVCAGTDPSNPKKLSPGAKANVHVADDDSGSEKPEATCYYEPTIVDKAGVLKEPDKLMATFNELYDLSGVCPVFISVYDEDWAKAGYADFSKYAARFTTVTMNQNAYVILYSVPGNVNQRTHYSFLAIQGDKAKTFMTESVCDHFNKIVLDETASGTSTTDAFVDAFEYAIQAANSKINPTQQERVLYLFKAYMPAIVATVIFAIVITILAVKYRNDNKTVQTEAPRNDSRFK